MIGGFLLHDRSCRGLRMHALPFGKAPAFFRMLGSDQDQLLTVQLIRTSLQECQSAEPGACSTSSGSISRDGTAAVYVIVAAAVYVIRTVPRYFADRNVRNCGRFWKVIRRIANAGATRTGTVILTAGQLSSRSPNSLPLPPSTPTLHPRPRAIRF